MEIFKFEKNDITRHIEYELRTLDKFKEPLNYVIRNLERLGHSMTIKSFDKKVNLKVKERKGKNYHWSVFNYKNATLIVRRYQQHLTIFTKVDKGFNKWDEPQSEYGAFTLHTNLEKFDDDKHDEMLDTYYSKPFTDLNVIVKDLFNLLLDKQFGVYWIWNSVSLKRPDHIELKLAFTAKEGGINSIDEFVFCMEELQSMYQELFAENTMVQKLKELKTGTKLNDRYKVGKITTTVKDDYYHGVGIEIIEGKEKKFQDVYSLTRWYFEDVFKDNIYLFKGEIYVEGGEFKEGEPVAYKNMDNSVTLYKNTYPKENFIPLKKY